MMAADMVVVQRFRKEETGLCSSGNDLAERWFFYDPLTAAAGKSSEAARVERVM
jgi:hypothetical protein